jgi:glutathione S-transferase
MSRGQIRFLDLACQKPCSSWLRHSLKTRLALNYKGLDYVTEWTEYPEIEGKVKPHLPPNASGPQYTIPTAVLADGTWVTDSMEIAKALEKLQPSPSLTLDSPYQAKVDESAVNVFQQVFPNIVNRIPNTILSEVSREYWFKSRKERLGMSTQEYEDKHAGPAAYEGAAPFLKEITRMLKENEGPFFSGKQVTYADFSWVNYINFFGRIHPDVYEAVMQATGDRAPHEALKEACAPWLERLTY